MWTLDRPYIVRSFPPTFSCSDFRLSCVWTLDAERHLHSPFKETSTLPGITQSTILCFLHAHKPQNRPTAHLSAATATVSLESAQNVNFALTYANNGGDKNSLLPRKFTRTRTCRRTTSKIHRAPALALALLRSVRHGTSIKRVDKKRLASRRDPMRARG